MTVRGGMEVEIPRRRCGLGMTTLVGSSLSFFREFALEEVFDQGFQHARREQIVNLGLAAADSGLSWRKSGGGVKNGIPANASRFGGGPVGIRASESLNEFSDDG